MRFNFTFLFLFLCFSAFGQTIPEFSRLSSRESESYSLFRSQLLPDGILYFIPSTTNDFNLYKVGFDGAVLDSSRIFIDEYSFLSMIFHYKNGRVFLAGDMIQPYTNFNELFTERRLGIVEIDADLEIKDYHFYDAVPYGAATVVSGILGNQTSSLVQPIDNCHLVGDTMIMVRRYSFIDTITFLPYGESERIIKMDLKNSGFTSKSIGVFVTQMLGSVILDTTIYVYAWASDCCVEILIDPVSAAEFDTQGNFKRKLSITPPLSPYFTSGYRISNRIYSSYSGGYSGAACETAVLDVRDLAFNLLYRTQVPDCRMAPSGTKCYARTADAIYFQTRSNDGKNIGLYKYDTTLNLIWGRVYKFDQQHYGLSINETPDGGVILECFEGETTLKLYKVSPSGDITSSVTLPVAARPRIRAWPNPFTDRVTLDGLPANGLYRVDLVDMSGRVCYSQRWSGTEIVFPETLPAGAYSLRVTSLLMNQVTGSQMVVKQ